MQRGMFLFIAQLLIILMLIRSLRDHLRDVFLRISLKVVSATFLLVWLVCLRKSTCETRKSVFYFTSKSVFVLETIKFLILRYLNVMTSSNALA